MCAAILLLAGMFAAEAQTPGDPPQKGSIVSIPSDVVKELAPTGKLRAAINLGNPVLAQGTPEAPRGVTVDLARELARRTGLDLELVPFPAAGKVFEALQAGARVTNPASRRVLEKCGFQWTGVGLYRIRALKSSAPIDRFRLERSIWASLKSWGRSRRVA